MSKEWSKVSTAPFWCQIYIVDPSSNAISTRGFLFQITTEYSVVNLITIAMSTWAFVDTPSVMRNYLDGLIDLGGGCSGAHGPAHQSNVSKSASGANQIQHARSASASTSYIEAP